jgi:hypothetical protein
MSATETTAKPDIAGRILVIRGQRVLVDRDLAECYEVATRELNQAVRRNQNRFPKDFAFRLSEGEKQQLITICDRFVSLKYSAVPPLAFTEHGVVMAASVLNSPRAVAASVAIVRVFVRLRALLASNDNLEQRVGELESRTSKHGRVIGELLKRMLETPEHEDKKRIGFVTDEGKNREQTRPSDSD